jgi:hypothetical protein
LLGVFEPTKRTTTTHPSPEPQDIP